MSNDKHVFKWVDEALHDEIKIVAVKAVRIEDEVKHMKMLCLDQMFEKMKIELEEKIMEKTELAITKSNASLIKLMWFVVVLGCILLIGCISK